MIKQSAFHPYPSEMLPTGFVYPERYLKLAQSTHSIQYDEEYIFPWWFVDYGTEGVCYWLVYGFLKGRCR